MVRPGSALTLPLGLNARSTVLSLKATYVRGSVLLNMYPHVSRVVAAAAGMAPEVATAVSSASASWDRFERFDGAMRALRRIGICPTLLAPDVQALTARRVPRGDGAWPSLGPRSDESRGGFGTPGCVSPDTKCAPAARRGKARETNCVALLAQPDDLVADRLERRGQLRGVAGEVVLALRLVRVEARRRGIVGDAHEDRCAGLGDAAGRLVQQVAQAERVDADRLRAARVGAGGVGDDLGQVAGSVVGVLHVVRVVAPRPTDQHALSGERRVVEVEPSRDARGDLDRVKALERYARDVTVHGLPVGVPPR